MKIGESGDTGSDRSDSAKESTEVKIHFKANKIHVADWPMSSAMFMGEKAEAEMKEKISQPKPQLSKP